LDGHSTHYQHETIKFAHDNGVVMMCLPPHTTHESQPLDASIFKPLKQNWNARFVQRNPGKVITKYDFSPLLNEAWSNTMISTVIASRSGIYPLNPKELDYGASKGTSLGETKTSTATSNTNGQAISTNAINTESSQSTFTSEEEKQLQRRYDNGFDIPDPQYLVWLKDRYPGRFQELSSSEVPTLAAIFNDSSQSELVLLNSTTVTPVNIEQQVDIGSADTEQPSVQTSRQGTSPPPDNAFCDMQRHVIPCARLSTC